MLFFNFILPCKDIAFSLYFSAQLYYIKTILNVKLFNLKYFVKYPR